MYSDYIIKTDINRYIKAANNFIPEYLADMN